MAYGQTGSGKTHSLASSDGLINSMLAHLFRSIEENPVHPNDLQATLLHCFGLNHKKLTYRFQGRDFRLTDVAGRVMKDWIN